MEKYAIINDSSFPLVRVTFTGYNSNDQNFQAYLNQMKACYRHKKKLALIFDASTASMPSLSHQKMQADWLRENKRLMQDYCLGTAYIIPNAAIRTLLKMIFSFQKQPVPYRVFETESEANDWVTGLFQL